MRKLCGRSLVYRQHQPSPSSALQAGCVSPPPVQTSATNLLHVRGLYLHWELLPNLLALPWEAPPWTWPGRGARATPIAFAQRGGVSGRDKIQWVREVMGGNRSLGDPKLYVEDGVAPPKSPFGDARFSALTLGPWGPSESPWECPGHCRVLTAPLLPPGGRLKHLPSSRAAETALARD